MFSDKPKTARLNPSLEIYPEKESQAADTQQSPGAPSKPAAKEKPAAPKEKRASRSKWEQFGWRLLAHALDSIVLFIPLAVLSLALAVPKLGTQSAEQGHTVLVYMLVYCALISLVAVPGLSVLLCLPVMILSNDLWYVPLSICLAAEFGGWLYRAGCESSPWRATIGKKAAGIIVERQDGERASFWRASARYLMRPLTALALSMPGIGLWFNSGSMLHDRLTGCAVEGAPPFVPPVPPAPANGIKFAPLWRRVCASVIDAFIVLSFEVFYMLVGTFHIAGLGLVGVNTLTILLFLVLTTSAGLTCAIAPLIFMAGLECSPLKASPGKWLLDLQVVSPGGERMTFRSSCYKQFVQYALWLSMFPLISVSSLLWIVGGGSWFKIPLGLLCGTWLVIYGGLLCVTFRGLTKQTFVDRMAKRFVICNPQRHSHRLIEDSPRLLKSLKVLCAVALTLFLAGSSILYLSRTPEHSGETSADKNNQTTKFYGEPSDRHAWIGNWLSPSGELIGPPANTEFCSFSEHSAPARFVDRNKWFPDEYRRNWGFIDEQGKWIISPQFDQTRNFSEGVAPAQIDYKWGLVDQRGNWLVSPQFDDLQSVSQGFAVARKGLDYGYIDRRGRWLVKEPLSLAYPFSNGFGAARLRDGTWTYVHSSGTMSRPRREPISTFSEGVAAVMQSGKWGYINTAGKWVIPPRYDFAGAFHNGCAIVRYQERSLLIDTTGGVLASGNQLCAIQTPSVMAVPAFEKNHWGILDAKGQFTARPELGGLEPYRNGTAFTFTKEDKNSDDFSPAAYIPRLSTNTAEGDGN